MTVRLSGFAIRQVDDSHFEAWLVIAGESELIGTFATFEEAAAADPRDANR